MNKKILYSAITVICLAAVLTGCGKGENNTGKNQNSSVWVSSQSSSDSGKNDQSSAEEKTPAANEGVDKADKGGKTVKASENETLGINEEIIVEENSSNGTSGGTENNSDSSQKDESSEWIGPY